jgi:hypothetical protein
MSIRTAAVAGTALVLALVLTASAAAKRAPADTTPPSPAPVLTANTVTSTWLSYSWTASQDSGSEVLYTVYLDGTPHLSNLPWRFANVFGLTPSSTHELRVDARDSFGNVSQSNVLSVTTPAPTNGVAPTAPANVQLGFQSGNGVIAASNGRLAVGGPLGRRGESRRSLRSGDSRQFAFTRRALLTSLRRDPAPVPPTLDSSPLSSARSSAVLRGPSRACDLPQLVRLA